MNESFGNAYKTIDQLDENDPYRYLFLSYTKSLDLLLYENEAEFRKFNPIINEWENHCLKTSDTLEHHYFSLSCMTIIQGVINYNYGNSIGAFFMLKKAKRLAEKSIKLYPDFIENQLLYGLLNISLGLIPEKYAWIANPLGFKGTFKLGLKALQKYSKQKGLFQQEAALIVQLLNAFLFDNHLKPAPVSPSSSVEWLMQAAICLKSNQSQQAWIALQKTTSKAPIKELMMAEASLLTGQYEQAYVHGKLFVKKTSGNNYLKASFRIQYLAAWLGDLHKNLAGLLIAIKNEGNALMAKDKEALSFAKKPQIEDKNLFESRMLFDGGAFQQALALVEKCNYSIERTYRKARILHLSNQWEKAEKLYKEVLTSGEKGKYYISNSSLQLGYIYHQKKETNKAIFYFQKARALHGEAYDEGIDRKAKLALAIWYDQ